MAQIVEHGGGGSAVAAPARDILLFARSGGLPPLEDLSGRRRRVIEDMRRDRRLGTGRPA